MEQATIYDHVCMFDRASTILNIERMTQGSQIHFKDKFNVPKGIYLASHSVGAQTLKGMSYAQVKFNEPWSHKGGDAWNDWLGLVDLFSKALAKLIGGQEGEYCPQANLSAGLTKYLTAQPTPTHKTEILMHADAFPSMGFVAQALAPRGFTFRLIPKDQPAHDPEVWKASISDKTGYALITHVHSNTGVRSDIEAIISVCRAHDVSPMVDIAQSVGILPVNVKTWGADLVLGSCVKWLCGGPGAGFMWVNPERLDQLEPEDVGWFSHENPFEFNIENFRYDKSAKRFWGGTPSVIPYAYALGGLETISEIGLNSIREHNIKLMRVVHPEIDPNTNGGTLCVPITDTQDTALKAAGCQFDRRGETARLSFHIFNTLEDAQIVRDSLKR